MHSIVEIIVPADRGADIVSAVKEVMDHFLLRAGDGETPADHTDWFDWYTVGGRYSGEKLKASLDPDRLKEFWDELQARGTTVSGIRFGKPDLQPASQIPVVDALWREFFPGKSNACVLFSHARDQYGRDGVSPDDVCRVADIPPRYGCERLILAASLNGKLKPVRMLAKTFWNGVQHQNTAFDGLALAAATKWIEADREGDEGLAAVGGKSYRDYLNGDWLAVTVDVHD